MHIIKLASTNFVFQSITGLNLCINSNKQFQLSVFCLHAQTFEIFKQGKQFTQNITKNLGYTKNI